MPAKVFISCGTMPGHEMDTATAVKQWLDQQGFVAHVAVTAQSLADVNTGIIGQLRTADYYLFLDFCREALPLISGGKQQLHRGSVYTHQELALAYCFGFDNCLFLQQSDMESKGIGQYLLANPIRFKDYGEVLGLVQHEVQMRGWSPSYTRHLRPVIITRATPHYPCKFGGRMVAMWHCAIQNGRREDAAVDTLARLNQVRDAQGNVLPHDDRSPLKWSLASGFKRTILPEDTERFDAFWLDTTNWTNVYLNSSRDVHPRQAIITTPGTYYLDYQVFAAGFPRRDFTVLLQVTGSDSTMGANIV